MEYLLSVDLYFALLVQKVCKGDVKKEMSVSVLSLLPAQTEEGKKELIFLSNYNPFQLMRICSSKWRKKQSSVIVQLHNSTMLVLPQILFLP